MKQFLMYLLCMAAVGCVSYNAKASSSIKPGVEAEFLGAKSVHVGSFASANKNISDTISTSIVDALFSKGVNVIDNNDADITIEGSITFSKDGVEASAATGAFSGYASSQASAGEYVSGISAKLKNRSGDLIGTAVMSQSRTGEGVEAPANMGRRLGMEISNLFNKNHLTNTIKIQKLSQNRKLKGN